MRARVAVSNRGAALPTGVLRATLALCDAGDIVLASDEGAPLVADELSLADFHAIAVLCAHVGLVEEPAAIVLCSNCDVEVSIRPCAAFEPAPLVDGELDDPTLDAAFDFDRELPIPSIATTEGAATTLRLRPVDVKGARPLIERDVLAPLRLTSTIVRAMGICAIGELRDPKLLARALDRASDEAFDAVSAHVLEAHYPERLSSSSPCPKCGASIVAPAPMDRELALASGASNAGDDFPTEAAFEADVLRLAAAHLRAHPELSLAVETGVPACDDAGVPLLGAYVASWQGDATSPSRPAEVTLYYRTFRAMWRDDGPYDVLAEIEETLSHEVEHHESALDGHDETDLEEHDAIAHEALRTVGRREIVRRATRGLGGDVAEFFRRTWILWVLVALAAIATYAQGR